MTIKPYAVHAIARAATLLVSLRYELVRHELTEVGCEARRVPFESSEKAVYAAPLVGAWPWHLGAWLDAPGDGLEGCLNLRVLG